MCFLGDTEDQQLSCIRFQGHILSHLHLYYLITLNIKSDTL